MMYIIKDENEIEKNQEIFKKILQHGINNPEERKIGYTPESQIKCYVYWSSELNFWSASYVHKTERGNRYSNYISFKEPPKDKEYLIEDVSISFSETGRTSSKFVKDENKIYFAHNGGVGNKGRAGKDDFMKYYRKDNNDVNIKDINNEKLILICELLSDEKKYPDLQNKVITFAREVDRIRKILDDEIINIVNATKVEKPKKEEAKKERKKEWCLCLNELFKKAEKEDKDYIEISAKDLRTKAEEMKIFGNEIINHLIPSICNAMGKKPIFQNGIDEVTNGNPDKPSTIFTIKYKLPRIKPIEDEQQSKNKSESVILIKKSLSESSDEIGKRKKMAISRENAQKYYDKLLSVHKTEIDLAYKVPIYKKIMENEILKEVTGISHYDDQYDNNNVITKSGQRKWLIDNREKRNINGGILNGFVPKVIVSGIQNIFDWRNVAEHKNKMLNSTYLGLFTTVALAIEFFSDVDIPKKIMDICNGNKQKTT